MTQQSDILTDNNYIPLFDYGFVGLIDVMGDDDAIADAARTSYKKHKKITNNRNLIRYLMRKRHTSPFEMAELKFHIKIPIFVMRQHVRHRTANLNEYSGRYSVMSDEMYLPEIDRIAFQATQNAQGSGEKMPEEDAKEIVQKMKDFYDESYKIYDYFIQKNLSRELARIVLPVANYTELYWKIDLKNFLNYLMLRNDSHAQKEINDLAYAMYQLVKPKFPVTIEAYDDYWNPKYAKYMSRMEMNFLKDIIKTHNIVFDQEKMMNVYGLSERECQEFLEKLE